MTTLLGIDIGGSGIKGAPVDISGGEMLGERFRIETPQRSTPAAVADVVARIADHFEGVEGPIGITFPAVVSNGVTLSAANVDKSWIGTDADGLFTDRCGRPVTVINDADAAAVAEMAHGAGVDRDGIVFVLTFGTGIGSGVFVNGQLFPNTELGHIEMRGGEAEHYVASRIKDDEGLSYQVWGARLGEFLAYLERLFSPDLFVIGGGISKHFDEFGSFSGLSAEVVPAVLRNNAGIVGAAMVAAAHQA